MEAISEFFKDISCQEIGQACLLSLSLKNTLRESLDIFIQLAYVISQIKSCQRFEHQTISHPSRNYHLSTKEYNKQNLVALIKAMRKFGFSEVWIDLVWRLISNCWFLILVNGETTGFFSSARDLRRGDPISPNLFIIAAEILGRGINKLHLTYNYLNYK